MQDFTSIIEVGSGFAPTEDSAPIKPVANETGGGERNMANRDVGSPGISVR